MRKVQTSRNRSDDETTDRMVCPIDDINDEVETLAMGRRSIFNTYLNWCYHLSTEWILCYFISNTSKQEHRKTDDVIPTPCRVDSGVELHLLGQDIGIATPPNSITLTFLFEDGMTTKHLPYPFYSQWTNIDALLDKLNHDNIMVHELWDVNEDTRIGSGDWDARIRPGSVIDAWCCNDERGYYSDDGDDSPGSEDGADMGRYCAYDVVNDRSSEHPWCFARWRERVEKDRLGKSRDMGGPSWFVMVIWCTSIVAGILVFSLVY